MLLNFLAQSPPSDTPLLIPLTLGPLLLFGGLYIMKVKQVRRTPFRGAIAVYVGAVFCTTGIALLLLGLFSTLFSQQVIPLYTGILQFILCGLTGAFLFAYILWFAGYR